MKKYWHKAKAYTRAKLTYSHALYDAVDDNIEVLEELLTYPDQLRMINTPYGNLTPLHCTILSENYKAMALFLVKGANPSPRTTSFLYSTPLHTAVRHEKVTAIRLLILYGADTDRLGDSNGKTPSMLAQGNNELLQVMKQAKAWRTLIEQQEAKAIQAESEGNTHLVMECYATLSEVWQQAAQQETHPDAKSHYEQKALIYSQPSSAILASSAKLKSSPSHTSRLDGCLKFFKTAVKPAPIPTGNDTHIPTADEQSTEVTPLLQDDFKSHP